MLIYIFVYDLHLRMHILLTGNYAIFNCFLSLGLVLITRKQAPVTCVGNILSGNHDWQRRQ